MAKDDTKNSTNEDNKKYDFNIIVSYANAGKSFQSIAENIILRRLDEID